MKKPLVSTITVTYNSSEYIEKCLQFLLKVDYQPLEVIVWDNDSTDNTVKLIEKYKKRAKIVISGKNSGYAEGNNKAINKAKGKYIFLMNPDTQVKGDFLDSLVEEMEKDSNIAACQPLVYLMKNKKQINLTGKKTQYLGFDWIKDYRKTKVPPKQEIASFSGSGVLIRKSVLSKTKGFDPIYFMYHEDTDLSWRFRLFGYKLVFVPKSIIFHDYKYIPKESYHPLKSKLKYFERNRLTTLIKNYETKTLLLLLPAIMFIELAMIIFSIYRGWIKQKLQGYGHIAKNIKKILENRTLIQKRRVVKDEEIIKDFESALGFEEFEIAPVKFIVNPVLTVYWSIIKRLI